MEKQERNYGIDLVKIVAMLMIVTLHVLGCGGILGASVTNPKNCAIAWFLEVAAFGAVNIYAMASGYLSVYSKPKYKSILRLWLQVFNYTTIITVIFFIKMPEVVGRQQLINAILPVTTTQYWYFTGYFCMFFFIPVMNMALEHLEKRQLQMILLASFLMFSFIPTVFRLDPFHENDGYSALWLAVMYMVGGYIRRYGMLQKVPNVILFLCYLSLVAGTWGYMWKTQGIAITMTGWISYLSPTILFGAVSLFLLFSRLNIKRGKKVIALVASSTFGIYIFHTHPLIWNYVLLNRFADFTKAGLRYLLTHIGLAVAAIFIGCMLVELVRKAIVGIIKKAFLSIRRTPA